MVVPTHTFLRRGLVGAVLAFGVVVGCRGSQDDGSVGAPEPGQARGSDPGAAPASRPATPPFQLTGDLEGLLLVWFDGEGTHTAEHRSDIPAAHREHVRVDSPAVAPEQRLPPDEVYVADLRANDKPYPVRVYARGAFDAMVDGEIAAAGPKAEDVVIYKASWCGVCKQAAAFLRQKNVPFIERDVEEDPSANAEMQRKARAAGKTPRGVPVIDFRGQILLGFDRQALTSLIDNTKPI